MPTLTAQSALLSGNPSFDGASFDSPPLDGPPLPPDELSAFLWTFFRIQRSPRRLAQLRMSGEGPPFLRDGNVVRYPPRLAAVWAVEQLGEPVRSTAEESARRLVATTT
jgi:hypothetical protein